MKCHRTLATLASVLFVHLTSAQTFSKCDPLHQSCPADPALGGSAQYHFTGPSSDFTPTGDTVSYNSDGAQLTVSASGDNPTLSSKWYIMFGHVDMVLKAAPGVGMVSSAILISDDLDEIDWEMLGADASQGQTNYFGKGVTGTYNRGSFSSVPNSQTEFNTYSVDWTADRIEWQLNGDTVRTLYAQDADGQYPQTPMQVKVGAWAGGDPSNSEGTIQWAGGPINYADGPFVMQVQSISVTDYSTGSAYQYSGTDGTWQEVKAIGGQVNPSGTPDSGSSNPGSSVYQPDASSNTEPTATHWPWVSSTGTVSLSSSEAQVSSYLASHGYNSGGHPSKTPAPASPTPSSDSSSGGGCDVISAYNQQGSPVVMTVPAGYKPSYNNQGALMTPPPCAATAPGPAAYASTIAPTITAVPSTLKTQPVPALQTQNSGPGFNHSSVPPPYNPSSGASQGVIPLMAGLTTSAVVLIAALL